jgi:long-chain acyl-CoA synthetase
MNDIEQMGITEHAARTPGKPALVMADGRCLTYADLEETSWQLARLLRLHGLGPGDSVAILMENRPEYAMAQWAVRRAGLDHVLLNTRLTPDELAYIIDGACAGALITSAALADRAARLPRPAVRMSVDAGLPDFIPLPAVLGEMTPDPLEGVPLGRDLMYSSGTTGRPKGIETAIGGDIGVIMQRMYGLTPDDVYLSPAPPYHTAPARTVAGLLTLGMTVVLMPSFDPRAFLGLVEQHRVTITQLVPTMFVRLLRLPPEERKAADLSSLRTVLHNAAPCPADVKEQMIEWWGPILHESYAATEGNGFTHVDSRDWLAHRGTVGKAAMGTIRILGEDGRELPPGETGLVYFDGGAEFSYRGDPEATARGRRPEGWTTTGDLGHVDEEGYLYLAGRADDMIICGGVNVHPQQAEDTLISHPRVLDAAVFGVPDDDMGERVHAVVQLVDAEAASPAVANELIAYCRGHLASIMCPRSIEFAAELPREPNGKLLKRLLRDARSPERSAR